VTLEAVVEPDNTTAQAGLSQMGMFRTGQASLVAVAIAFVPITMVGVADSSTPEAWAAHEKEVVSACAGASNLHDAKPAGKLVEFDDRVGFTAVIIDGRYPQPYMKNKRGRVLCLFDRRTRTPFVSDADFILREREP
jgi:hypothetical protein